MASPESFFFAEKSGCNDEADFSFAKFVAFIVPGSRASKSNVTGLNFRVCENPHMSRFLRLRNVRSLGNRSDLLF